MAATSITSRALVAFFLTFQACLSQTLSLYSVPVGIANTTTISTGCANAMKANIACDPELVDFATSGYYGALGNTSIQASFCASTCATSLASYHNSVASACAKDPQPWGGLPATWVGDSLWAYQNRTCLKNPSTGAYCTDEISQWAAQLPSTDTPIQSISKTNLCSTCFQALLQSIQATAYSNYGSNLASDYAAAQKICGTSKPTAVVPSPVNYTAPSVANVNTSYTKPIGCRSGHTYTVASGDSCPKIAAAQNVSQGTLQVINDIFPECTNLIAGSQLCLPQTCQTYAVQPNDTCWSIASNRSTTFLSYNPTINSDCSNLQSGNVICVGEPGAVFTPTAIANLTTTTPGPYALTTTAVPLPTPFGTTSRCGKYYQVQSGDYCQLLALNFSIPYDLFRQINPSVNANCTNLIPGDYYCVKPIYNWNATASATVSSSFVTPPAATPPGTTAQCYKYYKVVSSDTCSGIEQQFGLTFAVFQGWNPSLKSDCSNLILDDAYCVSGASAATASTTPATSGPTRTATPSTTTAYATAPTTTPSGTTAKCYKYYTVVSGDTCSGIDQKFGITFAQLQGWNPSLKSDCSNLLLGDAYCVQA